MSIEDVHIQCIDEVAVVCKGAFIMVHIYLVIFSLSRLGVRMWALFMGWWYLVPFWESMGLGFLFNARCEKRHALQIIGSRVFVMAATELSVDAL